MNNTPEHFERSGEWVRRNLKDSACMAEGCDGQFRKVAVTEDTREYKCNKCGATLSATKR